MVAGGWQCSHVEIAYMMALLYYIADEDENGLPASKSRRDIERALHAVLLSRGVDPEERMRQLRGFLDFARQHVVSLYTCVVTKKPHLISNAPKSSFQAAVSLLC